MLLILIVIVSFAFQFQEWILPFGLSLAPSVFKRCMKAALSPLCSDEGPICAQYTAAAGPQSQFGSLSDQGKEFSVSHIVHRDDINLVTMLASLSPSRTKDILNRLAQFRLGVVDGSHQYIGDVWP